MRDAAAAQECQKPRNHRRQGRPQATPGAAKTDRWSSILRERRKRHTGRKSGKPTARRRPISRHETVTALFNRAGEPVPVPVPDRQRGQDFDSRGYIVVQLRVISAELVT